MAGNKHTYPRLDMQYQCGWRCDEPEVGLESCECRSFRGGDAMATPAPANNSNLMLSESAKYETANFLM